MARTRKITPAPVVLTPEQVEANARRQAANDAHEAATTALIEGALALATKLRGDRVVAYGANIDHFAVMFGDPTGPRSHFGGPGCVELSVGVTYRTRDEATGLLVPPALRFTPRSYSLGSEEGIDACEALGRALVEAACFARTLQALVK